MLISLLPLIEGSLSIYDNDWLFWSKRNSKMFKGPLLTTISKQGYKCDVCGIYFSSDIPLELHYVDGNGKNNKCQNLEVLHRLCRQAQSIHWTKRLEKGNNLNKLGAV